MLIAVRYECSHISLVRNDCRLAVHHRPLSTVLHRDPVFLLVLQFSILFTLISGHCNTHFAQSDSSFTILACFVAGHIILALRCCMKGTAYPVHNQLSFIIALPDIMVCSTVSLQCFLLIAKRIIMLV